MVGQERTYLLPEQKNFCNYPTFLILPPIEEQTYYKYYFGFDGRTITERLAQNMPVIQATDHSKVEYVNRNTFLRLKYLLREAWQKYKDNLVEISQLPSATFSIFNFLEGLNLRYFPNDPAEIANMSSSYPFDKIQLYLRHYLMQCVGPTVVISETHAATHPFIGEVKSESPDAKIGLFVFDTHVDTLAESLKNRKALPDKTSVLRSLVKRRKSGRLVERVVCIGQPDELFSIQVGQFSDPAKFKGRIQVITEEDLFGDDPHDLTYSIAKLDQLIDEQMRIFFKKGINNVLLSLDIDILQSLALGLTAMEYNPLHALLYLSTLDLTSFKGDENDLYSLLTFDNPLRTILAEPSLMGNHGLSIPFISHAIHTIQKACKKYGIEYGIKYKDARVLGDIVELSGPDYRDLTKKAVVELVRALVNQ